VICEHPPITATTEALLMIEPCFCSSMWGSAALQHK